MIIIKKLIAQPRTKKDIDIKIAKYEYSNFWDRFFQLFWYQSQSSSFKQLLSEWQISGFRLEQAGQLCDACHNPNTRYFYEITNQKTGEKMNVGRSCAADLVFRPNMSKYNEITADDFQKFLEVIAKKTVFQRNRRFLESHGFDIQHAFSLLAKYRKLLDLNNKDQNALLQLRKKYQNSRASLIGSRKEFIFWHDLEMKALNNYLQRLKSRLPYYHFTQEKISSFNLPEMVSDRLFNSSGEQFYLKTNSVNIVSNVLNKMHVAANTADLVLGAINDRSRFEIYMRVLNNYAELYFNDSELEEIRSLINIWQKEPDDTSDLLDPEQVAVLINYYQELSKSGVLKEVIFEQNPQLQQKLKHIQRNSSLLSIEDLLFFQKITLKFGMELISIKQNSLKIPDNQLEVDATNSAERLILSEAISKQLQQIVNNEDVLQQMSFLEEYEQGRISHDLALTGTEVQQINELYERVLKKNSLDKAALEQKITEYNRGNRQKVPSINILTETVLNFHWLLPERSRKYQSSSFRNDLLYIANYYQKYQKLPETAFDKLFEVYLDYFHQDNHRFDLQNKIVPNLLGMMEIDKGSDNLAIFKAFLLTKKYSLVNEVIELVTLNFRQTYNIWKIYSENIAEFARFYQEARLTNLDRQQRFLLESTDHQAWQIYRKTGVVIPEVSVEQLPKISSVEVLKQISEARENNPLLNYLLQKSKKSYLLAGFNKILGYLEDYRYISLNQQQIIVDILNNPAQLIDQDNYRQLIEMINQQKIQIPVSQLSAIKDYKSDLFYRIIENCFNSAGLIFDLENIEQQNPYISFLKAAALLRSTDREQKQFLENIEKIQQDTINKIYFAVKDNSVVFNFGKNRDQKLTDKPDYLKWMLQADFPAIIKLIIAKYLN